MTTNFSTQQEQIASETAIASSPDPAILTKTQIDAANRAAWMRDQARIAAFFDRPGENVGQFWQQYKSLFIVAGYIILGLIALNLVLTIVGFIVSLPLVGGLLELIGLGYSIWFTNRYLLSAEKRQELVQKFAQIKKDILGGKEKMESMQTEPLIDVASTNSGMPETESMSDPMLVNSL